MRGGDYELPYSVLGREGSRDVLYVRRAIKHGRKRGNKLSLFIGRFRSSDETKHVRVVRWNHGMDVDDKAGLVQFLTELKPSKKRGISEVSPADAAESLPRPPPGQSPSSTLQHPHNNTANQ